MKSAWSDKKDSAVFKAVVRAYEQGVCVLASTKQDTEEAHNRLHKLEKKYEKQELQQKALEEFLNTWPYEEDQSAPIEDPPPKKERLGLCPKTNERHELITVSRVMGSEIFNSDTYWCKNCGMVAINLLEDNRKQQGNSSIYVYIVGSTTDTEITRADLLKVSTINTDMAYTHIGVKQNAR